MPVGNLPILRNIGGAIAPPAPPVLGHLPLNLFHFYLLEHLEKLGIKPQKSPKLKSSPPPSPIFISSPSPKYPQNISGDFRGKNPKNPQNQTYPRPRKIPKIGPRVCLIPTPSPKFGAGTGKIGDRGPVLPHYTITLPSTLVLDLRKMVGFPTFKQTRYLSWYLP